jgi:hypothetical protein
MNELIETLEKIKPAHLAYTLRAALNETLEIKDRVENDPVFDFQCFV